MTTNAGRPEPGEEKDRDLYKVLKAMHENLAKTTDQLLILNIIAWILIVTLMIFILIGCSHSNVTMAPAVDGSSLKSKHGLLAATSSSTDDTLISGGGHTFIIKTFTDYWLQPGGYDLNAWPIWVDNVLKNPLGTIEINAEYTK